MQSDTHQLTNYLGFAKGDEEEGFIHGHVLHGPHPQVVFDHLKELKRLCGAVDKIEFKRTCLSVLNVNIER